MLVVLPLALWGGLPLEPGRGGAVQGGMAFCCGKELSI